MADLSDDDIPEVMVEPSKNRRSARNRLACVLIVLVVLLSLIIVLCLTIQARVVLIVFPDKLIVPDTDNREYRVIQLINSIKVTLVSDVNSRTASTSFNVATGSIYNPEDILGLAHYLEHMLFMGTEKYPSENEADKVASENDGWINAWTDDSNTNYFFLVENDGLKPMSDVYAQFFIKPLLRKDSLAREMLAVESEYTMGFSSDFWPSYELQVALTNPESPYSRFSTGSIETLNRTDIQERLWEFYDRYYSANLMTIAIIGNETLDTLQSWAEEIFTSIPNKVRKKPVFNTLPFPPGDKRYITRRVYFQPKSDTDQLKVIFPVNVKGYPNLSYMTYLLGYEGRGSLFQYLSTRGYITSLLATIDVEAENFILVGIYCDLTELGIKQPNFIVEALFKFLKRIAINGVNEELWEENKKIDELKFKFKEKEDPASYASTISSTMAKREDPRDYLDPPSRRIYNEALELEIMSFLTPDNFNMYISSLKLSTDMKNMYGPQLTEKEKWYNTPFANPEIQEDDINNWKNVEVDKDLFLPEANVFIPEDFRMEDTEGAQALPVTIPDTGDISVWWYQDIEFDQPKIYIGCRIQPAPEVPTVRKNILSEMLGSMFSVETAESLYPAITVDYNFAFGFNDIWVLWLSGFSDPQKVEKIIAKGVDALFSLDFEQDIDHFNAAVREPIRKNYLNVKNLMPAQLARRYQRMLQDVYMFDYSAALDIIDDLTLDDIKQLMDDFLKNIAIDCSVMGNVREAQARNYANILQAKFSTLGLATIVKEDRLDSYDYPVYKLPKGVTIVMRKAAENVDEPNSGTLVSFQIGPIESNGPYIDAPKYTRYVLTTLLGLMMREPCFNYLRTQKQLGYVASCFEEEYKDILAYNILVQGSRADAGPIVMAQEIDNFVTLQYQTFTQSKNTAEGKQYWADIKVALQKQLEEKPISLSEKSSQFNKEIFSPTQDFERKKKKIAALQSVTIDEFLEYYQRYLLSSEKRKISAQVYGNQHLPFPKDVDTDEGEILVEDIEAYRGTLTEHFAADE